ILKHLVIPQSWTSSVIKPVPKKGDLSLIQNYRPISLSNTLRRLFERLMLPRLNSYIEPLHRSQNGFRSRRGCLDAAASLNEFIVQNKKETNLVFLDIFNPWLVLYRTWIIKMRNLGVVA